MTDRTSSRTWLTGGGLALLLLCLSPLALAHRVFYDFAGVVGDDVPRPFSGTLFFDTDGPFIIDDEDTGWVTHGRTGVLRFDLDGFTWRTTPGVDALCQVDFHEGPSVVRAWCRASRAQVPEVSDAIVLEFFEPDFRILYRDYDPIGPYDERTLLDYTLTATFILWAGEEPYFGFGGSGTVDRIRVVPEPGVAALLAALLWPFAGGWRAMRR